MKKMNNKGFSLVELIVVIAIMAVLVGVLAPQFIKFVESSRQSTDMQNIQQLKTAVEAYAASNEGLSTNVKITVNGTAKTVTVDPANAVSGSGLSGTTTLKSKTWDGTKDYEYSATTYTWTHPSCSNSGHPGNNNIATIFE